MKIKIQIDECKFDDKILCYTLSIFLFGYLGIFSRYRLVPSYCLLLFLFVYTFVFRKGKLLLDSMPKLWSIFALYVFFFFFIKNTSTGYWYVVLMINAVLILGINIKSGTLSYLMKCLKKGSLIFAFFTFANYLKPSFIIDVFGFMMSEGNIKTYNNILALGELPGLAGENSYNGFCLGIGILVAVSELFIDKRLKLGNIIYIICVYFAIYLTGRRSWLLLIPLVIAIAILIILIMKKNTKKKVMVMLGLVCAALLILYIVIPFVWEVLTEGTGKLQLSNREWFWGMAIELFQSNPIFGNGINTYDFLYNERKIQPGYLTYAGAHNSYLQFLAELGIFGLLIAIVGIIRSLFSTCGHIKEMLTCEASIEKQLAIFSLLGQLMIIFYALTENPFYQPQQHIMYFVFVACNLCSIRKIKAMITK